MSEKRYSYVEDYNSWFICDGAKRLYAEEVVDLLNEQQDTITKLKSIIQLRQEVQK